MKNLFHLRITKDTILAFVMGTIMIVLSLLMLPFEGTGMFDSIMSFVIRDISMILGLGVFFVTIYCRKKGADVYKELGFKKEKSIVSLIADFVLAVLLLLMFLKDETPKNIVCIENLYGAIYIVAAGIFEMLFIYGYLRMEFKKAFGTIPAVLITAAFYSFHHAGFQPEFLHLFFVGIMYAGVLAITNNLLIIFPFFWGVGALWDVLVSSTAGDALKNIDSGLIGVFIILVTIVWLFILRNKKTQIQESKEAC